jgi:hypothetical protein
MDFKGWPVDYSQLFAFSMPGIPVFLAVEGPERFPAFWVASGRLPSLTGRKSKIRRIEKQKAGTLPGHFPKKPLSHFGGDKDTAADPLSDLAPQGRARGAITRMLVSCRERGSLMLKKGGAREEV